MNNTNRFDRQGYIDRILSSSYSLREGEPSYNRYLSDINTLFDRFAEDGIIKVSTNTVAYIGTINVI